MAEKWELINAAGPSTKPNFEELQTKAEAGDPQSQFQLGLACETGANGSADTAAALTWFREAAERGLPDAQIKLGINHHRLSRRGFRGAMDEDIIEAYKWFSLAARRGNKKAINSRDLLAIHMTRDEVAEGNRRVTGFATRG